MTPEQFLLFCEDVYKADKTGNSGEAKIFFRAVHIGATRSLSSEPPDDETAIQGFELGRKLSRKVYSHSDTT